MSPTTASATSRRRWKNCLTPASVEDMASISFPVGTLHNDLSRPSSSRDPRNSTGHWILRAACEHNSSNCHRIWKHEHEVGRDMSKHSEVLYLELQCLSDSKEERRRHGG